MSKLSSREALERMVERHKELERLRKLEAAIAQRPDLLEKAPELRELINPTVLPPAGSDRPSTSSPAPETTAKASRRGSTKQKPKDTSAAAPVDVGLQGSVGSRQ